MESRRGQRPGGFFVAAFSFVASFSSPGWSRFGPLSHDGREGAPSKERGTRRGGLLNSLDSRIAEST